MVPSNVELDDFIFQVDGYLSTCPYQGTKVYQGDLAEDITAEPGHCVPLF